MLEEKHETLEEKHKILEEKYDDMSRSVDKFFSFYKLIIRVSEKLANFG